LITIDYFSDILCVWAYGGQIRLDELQREFGGRVLVRHRFMALFADTRTRIGEGWKDKGGFTAFGKHMQEVCAQWAHTRIHPGIWSECCPTSCVTSHVFLKAVSLCLGLEPAGDGPPEGADTSKRERFDALLWETRAAFFEQALDISRLPVLLELLEGTGVSADAVIAEIEGGGAFASLHRDEQLARTHGVLGSPTYVFNEGRQLLYGNVGYRIIAANLRELLSGKHPEGEPSWC
jgi:predicted DsbA family dithiol-disulfide isomerase